MSKKELIDEAAEMLVKVRLFCELGRSKEVNGLLCSDELRAKVDEAALRIQDACDARRMGHVPRSVVVGSPTRRERIIGALGDMVTDLFYYGRKEDEDLPLGALEEAIKAGEITTSEMVAVFHLRLEEGMSGKL